MLERMAAEPPSGFVARVRRAVSHRGGKAFEQADRAARRATVSARVRPTYLVIGAQKAGTSSLHHYLSDNPAVLTARVKEVQYFTRFYGRGEGWYRAQFPLVTNERAVRRQFGVAPAVGEATAACLFDPRSPERVHGFDPEMKLIAVLRDPIERAYSAFHMELRWGRETGTFDEALDREEAELPGVLERLQANPRVGPSRGFGRSYVARGLYADQLERWLQFFDREQLLILMSDELDHDPAGTMSRVAGFLGVPEWHAAEYPRRGVQEYEAMAPETRLRLARTFAAHDHRLVELLGRELPWSRATTHPRSQAGGAT
jgi:Sulfotransferase domain